MVDGPNNVRRDTRLASLLARFFLTYLTAILERMRTSWQNLSLVKSSVRRPEKSWTKVNVRTGNGTSFGRIAAVAPGTTYEYVATAGNGWNAVVIGSRVGWVSGKYSRII